MVEADASGVRAWPVDDAGGRFSGVGAARGDWAGPGEKRTRPGRSGRHHRGFGQPGGDTGAGRTSRLPHHQPARRLSEARLRIANRSIKEGRLKARLPMLNTEVSEILTILYQSS